MEKEKTALLCVLDACEDREKELLTMELGYRESTERWGSVLRGLRDRGLKMPLLAMGDGVFGLRGLRHAVGCEKWQRQRPRRPVKSYATAMW